MSLNLESKIEGLLFYKGENMSISKIGDILGTNENEVKEALSNLENSLSERGLVLMRKENEVYLGIHKDMSSLIESIRKEELNKELSKASLETLSIILYRNGITRSEIDYIRGVNSSFILRNLQIRGLVEKGIDEKDNRRIIYKPTFDLMSYMGVAKIEELPNYEKVINELQEVLREKENND